MRSKARPDFIFLQEAENFFSEVVNDQKENSMTTFLENCKNNGFLCVRNDTGEITIYRSDRFELQNEITKTEDDEKKVVHGNLQTCRFQDKRTLKKITAYNIHLEHSDNPTPVDKYVEEKLNESKDDFIIMGGDFNCRVVTRGKQNLVNGLVSAQFRADLSEYLEGGNDGYQGCDWTDGFFYTDKSGVIHQPKKLHTLNPATAAICDDIPLSLTKMPTNQKYELNRLRPFMTVAVEHDKHIEILFGSKAVNWLTHAKFHIAKKQYSNAFGDVFFGFKKGQEETPTYYQADDIAYLIAEHDQGIIFSKMLLDHFQEELKKIKDNYLGSKADKVYQEAKIILDSKNISTSEKQLISKALVNATYFIQNPLDPKAIQKLQEDAAAVKGVPKRCKKLLGALALLAGAAIIGLSIAGIPFTGGASLIAAYTVGSILTLSGLALFADGRAKSLSKNLSALAEVAIDKPSTTIK